MFTYNHYTVKTKTLIKKIKLCMSKHDYGFHPPQLSNNSFILTIENDNYIISFIHTIVDHSNKNITINAVYTHPNHRRKGLSLLIHNKLLAMFDQSYYVQFIPLSYEYSSLAYKIGIHTPNKK